MTKHVKAFFDTPPVCPQISIAHGDLLNAPRDTGMRTSGGEDRSTWGALPHGRARIGWLPQEEAPLGLAGLFLRAPLPLIRPALSM